MNQKILFLFTILLTGTICSCKKDTDPQPPATSYPDFSQLKVGNYWIYEQYDISSTSNATSRNIFDSCYVEKDTVILGKTYFKIVKPVWYYPTQKDISYLKDSLHYIINSNGDILFSSQDFSNKLSSRYVISGGNDTISQVVKQMADKNTTFTVPAGTFTTSNAQETHFIYPNYASAGNPRYRNIRYAENLGIVSETVLFFVSSPDYVERRLVRYHLN